MGATIFTGWIYDHLLPHAAQVKVAHPVMLRAITLAKKNDRIDAGKIAGCLRCDFLPECHMASTEIRDRRCSLRYPVVTFLRIDGDRRRWIPDGQPETIASSTSKTLRYSAK
jgi:hypothetical protein